MDLAAVAEHFDADAAEIGDPDQIREVVEWSIGRVPPICHDAGVPTVLDPTLTAYDTVYGAAGTAKAVFAAAPDTSAELADATVVDRTD